MTNDAVAACPVWRNAFPDSEAQIQKSFTQVLGQLRTSSEGSLKP